MIERAHLCFQCRWIMTAVQPAEHAHTLFIHVLSCMCKNVLPMIMLGNLQGRERVWKHARNSPCPITAANKGIAARRSVLLRLYTHTRRFYLCITTSRLFICSFNFFCILSCAKCYIQHRTYTVNSFEVFTYIVQHWCVQVWGIWLVFFTVLCDPAL